MCDPTTPDPKQSASRSSSGVSVFASIGQALRFEPRETRLEVVVLARSASPVSSRRRRRFALLAPASAREREPLVIDVRLAATGEAPPSPHGYLEFGRSTPLLAGFGPHDAGPAQ